MRFFSPPEKPSFRWRLANDRVHAEALHPLGHEHADLEDRHLLTGARRHGLAQERGHRHALDRLGVLEGEEDAGLGPHVGRPAGDVLAVEQDGAGGHRVGGVPEQRAGQRRLPGAVGAHQGVDLAGADGEVDAAQDGAVLHGDVEVPDLEQRGGGRHLSKLTVLVRFPGRVAAPASPDPAPAALTTPDPPIRARWGDSSPTVVDVPWPGRTRVPGSKRAKMRRSIDSMMVSKSAFSNEVLPGPPGKRVSPVNSRFVPSTAKQIEPGGVARRGDGLDPQVADARGARRRPGSGRSWAACLRRRWSRPRRYPASRTAGTAWMWSQWPCVSTTWVTPSCLQISRRALVLVGGVDEHGVPGAAATHDVDVVVHRAHDDLVDLGRRVAPDLLQLSHDPSVAQTRRPFGTDLVAEARGLVDTACQQATHRRRGCRGERQRSLGMNFAFSDEQEELRDRGAPVPGREVARDRGAPPDGDHARATTPRCGRQMADQLGPAVAHHPRGVRRLGLHVRGAARRARGDGRGAAVRARTSRRWRWRPTPCSPPATTRPRTTYLPGIASGETIATLAITEDNGKWDLGGIDARRHRDGRRLDR